MPNDSIASNNGFTPLPPTFGKTIHDDLILPGGKRLGDERKLASVLIDAGVPGVDHSQGREINAAAYAAHLDNIAQKAAKAAVAAWLDSSKRPL
jgi:hypothetical protein